MSDEELLYHYTTVESFVGIINSGELWASHIRYLNDTSEQRLFWNLVRERIKGILDALNESDRDQLLRVQAVAASPLDLDFYTLCFSKDGGDRLSQWRGYGGSGGVAIGFDPNELRKRCGGFTTAKSRNRHTSGGFAFLEEVKYIEPSGDDNFRDVIDLLIYSLTVSPPHGGQFTDDEIFNRRVALSSVGLKHNAFLEEREWRIIIFDLAEDDASVRFRTRKSMVVPYLPFELGAGGPIWPLISKVIVGPSPHKDETKTAIEKMLASPNIEITVSQTPYRDW